MSIEVITSYLNDHLAGATIAIEIVDRMIKEAPEHSEAFEMLRKDIDEDRQELQSLMAGMGVAESVTRKAGSWIINGITELKLYIDDPNGPLRRLERLEGLSIGIEGKIALWEALQAAGNSHLNYDLLIRRGRSQRAAVEAFRLQAARE